MRLKTTNKIAIERGIQEDNTSDILLVGCDSFCECDKTISDFVKHNKICSKGNSFLKLFGLNTKFYYRIEVQNCGILVSYEIGMGYLEKVEDKIYLKRNRPFFYSIDNLPAVPSNDVPVKFILNDHDYIVVSNYTPMTYLELLPDPNCIISSIDSFSPTTVYVNKNSILGRLDKNVESISIPSLLNQIIKYDEVEGKVKFFTGSKWITLVEESDEDTK